MNYYLSKESISEIDFLLSEIFTIWELVGLAVGIIRNNKPFYTKCFGVRNLQTHESIDNRSLFHCASISKTFVATGLFLLKEKGLIELDQPVTEYLPYFKLDDERYKKVTIQQMLSHTSGMPDTDDYEWDHPEYDEEALERYVKGLEKERLWLLFEPGEKFSYSNIAYEILGDVIAKVSGTSFENFIRKEILIPLEMRESTFLKSEVSPELATTPHKRELVPVISRIYPYNRSHAPSSTLHSSIEEMFNWLIFNLNRGEFKGKRLLNPSNYDLLWKQYAPTDKDPKRKAIGCGWFIGEHRGEKIIMHGGADDGYTGSISLLPDKSIGIVILCNTDPSVISRMLIENVILDCLLGFEVSKPKVPLFIELSTRIHKEGIEKAIQYYKKLRNNGFEGYYHGNHHLDFVGERLRKLKRMDEADSIFDLKTPEEKE